MSEFKQVNVTKAANIYFDGKVTSRKITFSDGSFKTLGIMMPGDYKFATKEKELM
ncbi:MAG: pyrimidine/purine nucleoside phosphorylase, partial [Photobacterium aquimaris]|nr:pyrimidine/purine nucleoside phosphorylase [Photobacterium aquimaris]